MELDGGPEFKVGDPLIPDAWLEDIVKDLNRPCVWFPSDPPPKYSWRKRLWVRVRNLRETVALRIAPWLDNADW